MKVALTVIATAFALMATSAHALDLTDRKVLVEGKLDVKKAGELAGKLIELDSKTTAPIFLLVTETEGTAQAVMILADTIQSVKSPVVGVALTQVHGTGAALLPFTDRLLMFRSSGLVLTELEYEGVKKPEVKEDEPVADDAAATPDDKTKDKKKANEPTKHELLLQQARLAFLDRFYGRLAKRVNMSKAELIAAIEAGGVIVPAKAAVEQKIAYAVVDQLTYAKLPVEKTEIKVTTSQKKIRTVTPDDAGDM